MRIRIIKRLQLEHRHGLLKGRVLNTCNAPEDADLRGGLMLPDAVGVWVMDDAGEVCRVWDFEYEEVTR